MKYTEVRTKLPKPLWEFVKVYASIKGITIEEALEKMILSEMVDAIAKATFG